MAYIDKYRWDVATLVTSTILNANEGEHDKIETPDGLRERVRERYAAAATTVKAGYGHASCCDDSDSCCGPMGAEVDETFGSVLYDATDRGSVPVTAVAASLGLRKPNRRGGAAGG